MHIIRSVHAWKTTAAALTLGIAGVVSAAHGTVQFSDGFAYNVGVLGADGPPVGAPTGETGWTSVSGGTQVTAASLLHAGVFSTGNKATVSGASTDISTANLSLAGTAGNNVEWVGFLINEASGGATPGGYAVLDLGFNGVSGPAFGMLFNQNVYGIDNDTADVERGSTTTGVSGTTVWMVAKLDFTAGVSYLFINPGSSAAPGNASASTSLTMTSTFKSSGFNQVTLAAGSNTAVFNLDEVRVGTTFADVVPEPSAAWLIAGAVGAWAVRRVLPGRRVSHTGVPS